MQWNDSMWTMANVFISALHFLIAIDRLIKAALYWLAKTTIFTAAIPWAATSQGKV